MDNYCKYIYYGAAQSGNLSLFKSMKSQGYPFGRKACTIAAENGHLNIIEWILSEIKMWKQFNERVYNNWVDNVICLAAASKGHLHILRIMPEDTHWNEAVNTALHYGQLEVLKWLQENNHIDVHGDLIVYAAKSGDLNILEWLQNEYKSDWNLPGAMYEAISIGNLDMIEYLEKKKVVTDVFCYNAAFQSGQFEVINWLYTNRCEWNSDTTTNAAFYGNLSILQWLIEKKCPVNLEEITKSAVQGGNLQIIEWLDRNFSIEWKDQILCSTAVLSSRWNILEWLLAKKCKVQKGSLVEAMRNGARLDILQKLFYVETDTDWDINSETAGLYGRFDFIEWISHRMDAQVCNTVWNDSYYGALRENQFDFMKKAYSNYCVCIESITRCLSSPALYKWLQKQECVQ